MAEYIKREAVSQVLQGIANGLLVGETDALKAKDMKSLLKIKAAKEILKTLDNDLCFIPTTDIQPIDDDNGHIIYIGRKAYLAENTIMEFMKKMDIIRDSLAYIENYFDTYVETIQQINACMGRCTDITEVKYFIDRIKENSGYD